MKKLLIFGITFLVALILFAPQKHSNYTVVAQIAQNTVAQNTVAQNTLKNNDATKQEFEPDLRKGGQNLQGSARSYMMGQLAGQGNITEGTVIHEATHYINSELTTALGGTETSPSRTYCAYYLWNEDQYLVLPASGFAKSIVASRVPLDTVTQSTYNNYFGPMFASRDAIHIVNDFVAELNGFEADSPGLLRDMLIYSVALGLELQQRNDERLHQYQSGDKFLIERASKKAIDLTSFRTSLNSKAIALRKYLINTYGNDWTRRVLKF